MKVAITGDIHIHENLHNDKHDMFAHVSDEADIFLMCGDLTYSGIPQEAKRLAEYVNACRIPILAVLGNHDYHNNQQNEIKKILSGKIQFLEDQPFIKNSTGFVGTKGFGGGFDKQMLSAFGEKANKDFVAEAVNEAMKLENDLRTISASTEKNIVILHYAPVIDTVHGEPEAIFPFLGCTRFAETIDRFPVALVAHGHSHHGTPEGKTTKGIPVYNCAYEVLERSYNKPYRIFTI